MGQKYIGRQKYLDRLRTLEQKQKASLVVIKGCRRVGKSRLAEEFAKDKIYIPFTGLSPELNSTSQDQLNHFAQQLTERFELPPHTFLDWTDAFYALGRQLQSIQGGKTIVVLFDEISWMAHNSPKFLGQLKAWWDINHPKFQNLILILCGSVSSWIEENILQSTAFFGRVSLEITLPPLSLSECAEFLRQNNIRGSAYEYYQILSITGGIPWYLEQLSSNQLINMQIMSLCFQPDGLLINEFDRIFHDLFGQQGEIYKKIIQILGDGMRTHAEIREEIKYAHSGTLSKLIHNLIISGFVTEHTQWSLKSGKTSRQSLYRLNDQYVRFYLKYIEPNLGKIRRGIFDISDPIKLPGWDKMMGFQVESFLLQNRAIILKSLGIQGQDVICDNPFIQRPTIRRKGCQIDYLIQTNGRSLFICEFKFNRHGIGMDIIEEMKEKMKKLSAPSWYARVPVLLHLGEVSEAVYQSNFFYRIINISDYLEGEGG